MSLMRGVMGEVKPLLLPCNYWSYAYTVLRKYVRKLCDTQIRTYAFAYVRSSSWRFAASLPTLL